MARKSAASSRIEVLQGTLDLIILQALRWGPRHGYGLMQLIHAQTAGVLQVDTGSLYPALHRLEAAGGISAAWELSDNRQRVRVYTLTAAGRRHLAQERARWDQLSRAVAGMFVAPVAEES